MIVAIAFACYNPVMTKKTAEGDGGPFPPVSGRAPTFQDMHEADIAQGMESRKHERKRRAGVLAALTSATKGQPLQEQIVAAMRAIRKTR